MKFLCCCLGLFFSWGVFAQVNGLVQGNNGEKTEAIYGAKIKLLQAKKGSCN